MFTAVSQVLNQFGNAGSYLEPLLVRAPSSSTTPEEIKGDIRRLMNICEQTIIIHCLSSLGKTVSRLIPFHNSTVPNISLQLNDPCLILYRGWSWFDSVSGSVGVLSSQAPVSTLTYITRRQTRLQRQCPKNHQVRSLLLIFTASNNREL